MEIGSERRWRCMQLNWFVRQEEVLVLFELAHANVELVIIRDLAGRQQKDRDMQQSNREASYVTSGLVMFIY